jgi:two-component system, sensor histidine kinase and response regulator
LHAGFLVPGRATSRVADFTRPNLRGESPRYQNEVPMAADDSLPSSPFDSVEFGDLFREIIDSALDAVITTDGAGLIVDWNSQAEVIFGWKLAEVAGKHIADAVIPRRHRRRFARAIRNFQANLRGKVFARRTEQTAVHRDGREFPVELSITPIHYGDAVMLTAFVRDISQRKRYEARLERQALEARLLHQATTVAAEAASFNEALEQCVNIICELTNWPVGHVFVPDPSGEVLVSPGIWYFDHPEDHVALREISERVRLRRGEGFAGRIWETGDPSWIANIRSDPTFVRARECSQLSVKGVFGFPVRVRSEIVAVLEFFTRGEVAPDAQLLLLIRNISDQLGRVFERKKAEQERAQLAAIVDSSYDAIIGLNLEGIITTWNAGAAWVYGYSAEEAIGQPVSLITPDRGSDEDSELIDALQEGRRLEQFAVVRQRKDGELIDVSITSSPLRDSFGRLVGSSSIERDVSAQKRHETMLREAKDAAEAANRAKSEFLANISHELRTPMNAILGMTDLALEEDLAPMVRDYLETGHDSARTLLYLLNDVLDFSRMEAGRFELNPAPFDLRQILDETIRIVSLRAHEKGLELAYDLPANVPTALFGDGGRLRQVIMNLVGNAVKFTEQGEVLVAVHCVDRRDGQVCLQFEVSDTGIGISAADQEQIFAPFTQVDASTTRRHTGSGLGLTICREIVDLMQGRLWVDSEPDRGSCFSFLVWFDLSDQPVDAAGNGGAPDLAGLPVLVVDDSRTNLRIVGEYLKNWSMQPKLVDDPQSALAELRAASSDGRPYPLCIVDALMPELDGFSLIELVRADPKLAGATVLMLASADRQVFDERCRELEIADYLEKPVSQSRLLDAMLTALDVSPPVGEAASPALRASHPLRVLIAEDTPANQKVVRSILEKRGHRTELANNGREAIDLIESKKYDVVLMDVQMPVDGRLPRPPGRSARWRPSAQPPAAATRPGGDCPSSP